MTATARVETVQLGHSAAYPEKPLPVMLLISGLEHGGAERQVIELHKAMDRRRFEPFICSLSDHVPLAKTLERGRDLVIVPKRWKYDASTIVRVGQLARARRVSVIHSFLFDAEIVARALRRTNVVPVVIASERNTDYAIGPLKSACLSMTRWWFDAMIANSAAGKDFNVRKVGIAPERIHVIRNGVDVERFRPTDGRALRARLGIPERAPLVGMIASFKRQKRHGDFFQAARQVMQQIPDAWFVCVGEPLRDNQQGAGDYHAEMRQLVRSLGLEERMRFAGNQEDMPAAYSACDVTVLTSSREGTPNVLLESMACEVPVVATDIADNGVIVPDNEVGFIVPLGHPDQVADRLARLLSDGARRTMMGRSARAWVTREFSTTTLARRTEDVYTQMLHLRSAFR
jgi:glycosyltransferase involved in cell wall biosynthesis